jgi:hypothetical protein
VQPASKANDADELQRTSAIHERLLLVSGFLGGLAFTALVLILQASANFEPSAWGIGGAIYFDALIALVGGVSVIFIMASISSVGLAAGTIGSETREKQNDLAGDYFVFGWLGLMVAIPLLLLPFFWGTSLVVGLFEIILFRRILKLT